MQTASCQPMNAHNIQFLLPDDEPTTPPSLRSTLTWGAALFLCLFATLYTGLYVVQEQKLQIKFDRPVSGYFTTGYNRFPDCFFRHDNGFSESRHCINVVENSNTAILDIPRLACRLRLAPNPGARADIVSITANGTTYLPESLQHMLIPLKDLAPLRIEHGTAILSATGPNPQFEIDLYLGPSLAGLLALAAGSLAITALWIFLRHRQQAASSYIRRHELAAALICSSLCLGYILMRFSERILLPQFWAEDGQVFYKDSYEHGFASLWMDYFGYMITHQRLAALISSPLPMQWAPQTYLLFAIIALLLLFWAIWRRESPLNTGGKILCTLSLPLLTGCGETFLILTNSHWLLAFGMFLILLSAPAQTRARRIASTLYLLVAGFSGPFVLMVAPAVLLRALILRKTLSRGEKERVALFAAIFIVNICIFKLRPSLNLLAPIDAWIYASKNIFLTYLFGLIPHYRYPNSLFYLAVPCIFVLTLGLLQLRRPLTGRDSVNRLTFLLCGCSIFAATLYDHRFGPHMITADKIGERYLFVLYLTISWLLCMIITRPGKGWISIVKQIVAICLLAVCCQSSVLYFSTKLPWPDTKFNEQVELFRERGRFEFSILPDPATFKFTLHANEPDSPATGQSPDITGSGTAERGQKSSELSGNDTIE